MDKSNIGLIGLAVMGQNIVLNMESRGYKVSVYNRSGEKTKEFMDGPAKDKSNICAAYTLEEFVQSIDKPRKILIMVKAGEAVDNVINSLVPLLDQGDIIIDGGNSYFKDTIRRNNALSSKGLFFIGTGISGGEEGALKGPSIMPGGSVEAWQQVKDILVCISAKVNEGIPCCDYIGEDGAGHYVKMIHNGIEYGDMQLISEAYFLLKNLLNMSAQEMHNVFSEWNKGELDSYLIEITADILKKVDEHTGKPLVDMILDTAGQKGTGKWTSQEALELGVTVPTIAEAVFARYISANKKDRVEASKELKGPDIVFNGDREQLIHDVQKALYASKICSYAQGFDLLKQASEAYNWNLKLGDIALLWRGGCIIRAQFLNRIKEAYDNNSNLKNILLDPYFKNIVNDYQNSWRRIISLAAVNGIPVPCFSSALTYYDSYRMERLSANMIQAQRDYFGSHTYERIDMEGIFHTQWMEK